MKLPIIYTKCPDQTPKSNLGNKMLVLWNSYYKSILSTDEEKHAHMVNEMSVIIFISSASFRICWPDCIKKVRLQPPIIAYIMLYIGVYIVHLQRFMRYKVSILCPWLYQCFLCSRLVVLRTVKNGIAVLQ